MDKWNDLVQEFYSWEVLGPVVEMVDHNYTADSVKSLDWKDHIRLRPGMYIGKLGDGSSDDDGIYVLLK